MVVTDLTSDLALALDLADTADQITLARAGATDLRVDRKPDRTPVTDADLAVEDAIREVLEAQRPQDAILGEERGGPFSAGPGDADGAARSAGRMWLLDPIDGTKNFLRGVPVWATLIALVEHGKPAVGVISAPALRRRWWAATGAGAHTRDPHGGTRAITVSRVGDLADAYISTTDLGSWAKHHSRESYLSLVDASWESRAFGDFWQHCLVAEGALDVAAEAIVNPWDVAAAQILVEQAGGRFTDLDGVARYDGGSALSSNGLVHDDALALLRLP
ncbi:MAG: inositol monophosphatase family protein [Pseudonocardiaceae bacterium]